MITEEQRLSRKREYYYKNIEREKARAHKNNIRTRERRRELVSEFSCVSCSLHNPWIIEWHHVDPETKERHVFTGNPSEETFWNELLKCVPLCPNCHSLIHKDLLCLIPLKLR